MKDKATYQKAIRNLPTHQVSGNIWDRIEQELDEKTNIALQLPTHIAREDLWESIEASLDNKKSRTKTRVILRWTAAAAAIILLALPMGKYSFNEKNVKWVTSEENIETIAIEISSDLNLEDDILAYCSQNPSVCESPDFNSLNSMLDQLKNEREKLVELSKQLNDPSIKDYLNTVNNNIAQVQRKLLSLF